MRARRIENRCTGTDRLDRAHLRPDHQRRHGIPSSPTGAACRGQRAQPGRGRKPRQVGHNLLLRLQGRKQDVLRFLSDLAVSFTNNLAERDGRMMKLRQKISGGFRSTEGAGDFAGVRSLISTAKKQGWDVMHTLNQSPDTLLAMLQPA
jgi:transposase